MRPILLSVVFFLVGFVAAGPALGGMYSYKDEDGVIYLTDEPPDDQKAKLLLPSLKKQKGFRERGLVGTGRQFKTTMQSVGRSYGLSKPLLWAVIKTESNFNPQAVSPKGAMGLMQLMPDTARALGVENPYDPEENIRGGSRFLKQLLNRFKDVNLALAAYNAGPGAVEKYGGVPPYPETRRYIERVRYYYDYYRRKKNMLDMPEAARVFNQGYVAFSRGDLARADEAFKRVVAKYPASAEAHYNLALVSDRINKLDQARRHYLEAIRYDSRLTDAYWNLAILYERQKNISAAVSMWRRVQRIAVAEHDRAKAKVYMEELIRFARQ